MKKQGLLVSALLSTTLLNAGLSFAADQAQPSEKVQAPQKQQTHRQQPIYGSQLMTRQERAEHRAKMRAAKSPEEREKIRNEHHEKMKLLAKERGVTLPDVPPARGGGMGPGNGMGPGSGGMRSGDQNP